MPARLPAAAAVPAARARAILLSFVALFLIFVSVGHAQTIRNGTIRFWLTWEQVGGARTVCVGDRVLFNVNVVRSVVFSGNSVVLNVSNTEVSSSVSVVRVGSVAPERTAVRLNSLPPNTVQFTFTAQEAGTTPVVFRASVNRRTFLGLEVSGERLTAVANIKVEDCTYTVTTVSRWRVPGPANIVAVATIARAGMVSTGQGRYEGLASVQWTFEVGRVGECIGNITVPPSQAELNGSIVNDRLTVDIGYHTAQANLYQYCRSIPNLMVFGILPAPLTVTLPWRGGSQSTRPVLRNPEPGVGRGSILVERVVTQ